MTIQDETDPALAARRNRCRFRAWHRGTREADFLIGGFFDRFQADWNEAELAWFEALLEEDDVEIMAWAIGAQPPPPRYGGSQMEAMQRLDYLHIHR